MAEENRESLGEILVRKKVIDQDILNIALSDYQVKGGKFEDVLAQAVFVPEETVARALAEKLGIRFVDIRKTEVDIKTAKKFSSDQIPRWGILPFKEDDRTVHIIFADPSFDVRVQVERYVRKRFRKEMAAYCAQRSEVEIKISEIYDEFSYERTVDHYIEEALRYEKQANMANVAIFPLLESLIDEAISQRATDLHFVDDGISFRLFVRQDGGFHHRRSLPAPLKQKLSSAVKQKAGMDAGDRIHAQDGHFSHFFGGNMVNIRVSAIPLVNSGESIVLRILDETRVAFDLDTLGFFEGHLRVIKRILEKPYGLILVTGPTGSGKTTTLYSIINYLRPARNSILTIEDPVEYSLPFVRQVQVNARAGRVPDKILRAFLRHDPDIILVGEIRDSETAEVTIQAAETGHLVLSTLHTNNSPSALLRLRDLGVSDMSLCYSLHLVISQRLVKRICDNCRKEYRLSGFEASYVSEAGFDPDAAFYRGEGCNACKGTGYRGVDIVYEILAVDEYDYEKIKSAQTATEVLEFAEEKGYQPMRQNGLKKAIEGITTVREVIRTCG